MKLPHKYRVELACQTLNNLTRPSRMETNERWATLHARARKLRAWLRSHAVEGVDWYESDSGQIWAGESARRIKAIQMGLQ